LFGSGFILATATRPTQCRTDIRPAGHLLAKGLTLATLAALATAISDSVAPAVASTQPAEAVREELRE
jgi:hypothetical protein